MYKFWWYILLFRLVIVSELKTQNVTYNMNKSTTSVVSWHRHIAVLLQLWIIEAAHHLWYPSGTKNILYFRYDPRDKPKTSTCIRPITKHFYCSHLQTLSCQLVHYLVMHIDKYWGNRSKNCQQYGVIVKACAST